MPEAISRQFSHKTLFSAKKKKKFCVGSDFRQHFVLLYRDKHGQIRRLCVEMIGKWSRLCNCSHEGLLFLNDYSEHQMILHAHYMHLYARAQYLDLWIKSPLGTWGAPGPVCQFHNHFPYLWRLCVFSEIFVLPTNSGLSSMINIWRDWRGHGAISIGCVCVVWDRLGSNWVSLSVCVGSLAPGASLDC